MILCPHCGAENSDSSDFCSLCLARFATAGGEAAVPGPATASRARSSVETPQGPPVNQGASEYVSPGDYHALAREMQQGHNTQPQVGASYRDTAYYQSTKQDPDAMVGISAPKWVKRSTSDKLIMVLKHSLIMYFLLLAVLFVMAFVLAGLIMGGGINGLNIGTAILYVVEMMILIGAGYRISVEAMEAGKGWLYGAACVGAIIFFWQPLIAFIIGFFLTGKAFAPVFNLYGLMIAVFLYLPMGALGGWMAEKRYMG